MNGRLIVFAAALYMILPGFQNTCLSWDGFAYAIGGSHDDGGEVVLLSPLSDLVISGYTNSYGAGNYDLLHLKIDSLGTLAWAWTVGGSGEESSEDMVMLSGGACLVTGYTESFGTGGDLWLMKFSASGSLEWAKTFGGSGFEAGWIMDGTSDGGCIVVGETDSYGAGNVDFLVVKFNSSGDVEWARAIGGSGWDVGLGIDQTSDGGYVLTGETWSWGPGNSDILLVKLSSAGAVQWAKALGASQHEYGGTVEATSTGILVTCASDSYGSYGFQTFWVMLDNSGLFLWGKLFGGSDDDYGYSTLLTTPDGYTVFGSLYNSSSDDEDVIVVSIDPSLSIDWVAQIGGTGEEDCWTGIQTASGDFLLTGETSSWGAGDSDILLAGLDSNGNSCIGDFTSFTMDDIVPVIQDVSPGSEVISLSSVSISPTVQAFVPNIENLNPYGIEEAEETEGSHPTLLVQPNPWSSSATLTLQLHGESTVTLTLYDLSGRAVATLAEEEVLPSGESFWTVSDLDTGLYLLRMRTDDVSITQRMVVAR